MKKVRIIALAVIIAILLSLTVISTVDKENKTLKKLNKNLHKITDNINLEQNEHCTTKFYTKTQPIYSQCIHYINSTHCLNTSGINTDCTPKTDEIKRTCKTSEITVHKNNTQCKPENKYLITNKNTLKNLDFTHFGPCKHEKENNCLIITCVSKYDGAHNGQFTDCNPGKSCQKFQICDGNIKKFYKNSRNNFAEDDPTFHLKKLSLEEVEE